LPQVPNGACIEARAFSRRLGNVPAARRLTPTYHGPAWRTYVSWPCLTLCVMAVLGAATHDFLCPRERTPVSSHREPP
jgi:hypothetical protein